MITYIEESKKTLNEYKTVTISFEVKSVYNVELINNGLGGFKLLEKEVTPYWHDYDGESDTSNPFTWASRWDISNWLILAAYDGNKRVGGAVVAHKTDGVNMLEDKDDLAVLWDIRVDHDYRGKGIGKELIARCIAWAKERKFV
jgi:streptothricin acetyltransferase